MLALLLEQPWRPSAQATATVASAAVARVGQRRRCVGCLLSRAREKKMESECRKRGRLMEGVISLARVHVGAWPVRSATSRETRGLLFVCVLCLVCRV